MREIKTIGDLYAADLLRGIYPSLKKYYINHVERAYDPKKPHICKPLSYIERDFLKEPVEYLKTIDYSEIMNLGRGKKEATLKIIFENLGFEWLPEYNLRWNDKEVFNSHG